MHQKRQSLTAARRGNFESNCTSYFLHKSRAPQQDMRCCGRFHRYRTTPTPQPPMRHVTLLKILVLYCSTLINAVPEAKKTHEYIHVDICHMNTHINRNEGSFVCVPFTFMSVYRNSTPMQLPRVAPAAHMFLLCFAVTYPISVNKKWPLLTIKTWNVCGDFYSQVPSGDRAVHNSRKISCASTAHPETISTANLPTWAFLLRSGRRFDVQGVPELVIHDL